MKNRQNSAMKIDFYNDLDSWHRLPEPIRPQKNRFNNQKFSVNRRLVKRAADKYLCDIFIQQKYPKIDLLFTYKILDIQTRVVLERYNGEMQGEFDYEICFFTSKLGPEEQNWSYRHNTYRF